MTINDSPDWQDYPQWRATPLYYATTTVTSVSGFSQTYIVPNWASVYLFLQLTSGTGVTVQLQFFADAALTMPLNGPIYVVTNNLTLAVIVPALGNYLQVTVTTAQAGSQVCKLGIVPVNIQTQVPRHQPINNTQTANSASVAASSTVSFFMPFVTYGTALLFFQPGDASGKLGISASPVAENGTAGNPLYFDIMPAVNGQPTSVMIPSPNSPLVIKVQNFDGAAAHTFTMSCQALSQ